MMDKDTARQKGYRRYGVYVNPTGVWFQPSRLKSEAQRLRLAWWVYATDPDDALDHLMTLFVDRQLVEYIKENRRDPRRVLVEEEKE